MYTAQECQPHESSHSELSHLEVPWFLGGTFARNCFWIPNSGLKLANRSNTDGPTWKHRSAMRFIQRAEQARSPVVSELLCNCELGSLDLESPDSVRLCRREKLEMSCTALERPSQPQAANSPQVDSAVAVCPDAAVYGATLVYFMHRLLDFREAELHALASMSGISREDLKQRKLPNDHDLSPLRVIAPLTRQQQEAICNRAVLVKVCPAHAYKCPAAANAFCRHLINLNSGNVRDLGPRKHSNWAQGVAAAVPTAHQGPVARQERIVPLCRRWIRQKDP